MGDLLKFLVVITGDGGSRRDLGLKLGPWYLDGLLGVSGGLPGLLDRILSSAVEEYVLACLARPQAYSVSVDRLLSPKE